MLKVSGSDTEGLTVGTIGGIRLWLDVRFAWHLNTSYGIYKRYDNRNCSSISAICSHAKYIQHLIQHTAEIAQSVCSHYRLRQYYLKSLHCILLRFRLKYLWYGLLFNMSTRIEQLHANPTTKYKVFLHIHVLKYAVSGRQLQSDTTTTSAGC